MQGWLGWAYVAVTLGYLAAAGGYAWALGSLARDAAARWLARVTWAVHTGLLAVAVATGHVPFLSPQGSVFFLGWGWVLNGLVLESLLGLRALGAFMLPPVVALLVLVAAVGGPARAGAVAAADEGLPAASAAAVAGLGGGDPFGAPWIWLHAIIALLSYCAFGLASALAAMYLLQERQLRSKVFSRLYRHLPALEEMDRACWWLIGSGFALLTLALASGTLSAGQLWDDRWASDGKVIASLAAWLFYGLLLTLRAVAGWRGRRLAYLSLVGFAVILFNYLVVGPHWSTRHVF
ncbi:cytochrome C assembly protein [Thermaerobacter sp. FW80]|nr:cytochrome C assembly protein [Thermaerobacter sp. FW80]